MKRLFTILALITWSALSSAQPAPVPTAARPPVTPNDGPLPWNYGPYAYDPAGNVTAIGSQYFVYDPMGRLVKSSTAQTPQQQLQQAQEFSYDVYGNMTQMKNAGVTTNFTIDATSNHLLNANVSYDAAGNVLTWKPEGSAYQRNYTYDALNRIGEERVAGNAAEVVYHVYTADDERYWTYTYHDSAVSHFTLRDLNGKVQRDFKFDGTDYSVFRDYVYRDGTLLASLTPTAEQHISVDHLGSPRLITNANRYRLGAHTYMPFGLEWTDGTSQEGDALKFTAHERDTTFVASDVEAGRLDYMHARFYSANLGRFLSLDPVIAIPSKPQSWNKYSYVQNQPINFLDPTGAYRTDFHYALTRIIAVAAGYSVADATTIAAMTELPDHDARNPETASNVGARAAYHFPSAGRLHAMYVDAMATSGGFFEIGTYLHALQDSFSHRGHGPLIGHIGPLLTGAFVDGANSLFGGPTGAMGAGYEESYDVDTTSSRPSLAMDAARATYDALVKFNGGHATASFSAISSSINGYLAADEHSVLRGFYENRLKAQLGMP